MVLYDFRVITVSRFDKMLVTARSLSCHPDIEELMKTEGHVWIIVDNCIPGGDDSFAIRDTQFACYIIYF